MRPDLTALRDEYLKIDRDDDDALRQWFMDHPYLTSSDRIQIMRISNNYYYKIRKRLGLSKRKVSGGKQQVIPKIVALNVPPNDGWRNPEWLSKAVKLYPISTIAKAVQRNRLVIVKLMKRWNIEPHKSINHHPCNTRKWCYDHYVTRHMSQRQCAALAGISLRTFENWLNKHEIPIRDHTEAVCGTKTNTIIRKCVYDLLRQPVVKKVTPRQYWMKVKYRNSLPENYYYEHMRDSKYLFSRDFVVPKDQFIINKAPVLRYEYEGPLDEPNPFPMHMTIPRSYLVKASFIEQRLAVHIFVNFLINIPNLWLKYPLSVLNDDWQRVKTADYDHPISKGKFTVYSHRSQSKGCGRYLMEHYFGLGRHANFFYKHSLRSWYIVNRLLEYKNWKFNTRNVIRMLIRNGCHGSWYKENKLRYLDPIIPASLLSKLDINGSILDLNPSTGGTAMACALNNLKYMTLDNDEYENERFKNSLALGFGDQINLRHAYYSGQDVNTLLHIDLTNNPNMDNIMSYADRVKNMIVYVRREHVTPIVNEYNPSRIVPIQMRRNAIDSLLIW